MPARFSLYVHLSCFQSSTVTPLFLNSTCLQRPYLVTCSGVTAYVGLTYLFAIVMSNSALPWASTREA